MSNPIGPTVVVQELKAIASTSSEGRTFTLSIAGKSNDTIDDRVVVTRFVIRMSID